MWQPDGWGQTRIGVLTPHADIVPESEFSALAPAGISIHATRVFFGAALMQEMSRTAFRW
jgi:maleate isomerase